MELNYFSLFTWEEFQKKFLMKPRKNINFNQKKKDDGEEKMEVKSYINWVGTQDFSPVRQVTNQCTNPYWAITVA